MSHDAGRKRDMLLCPAFTPAALVKWTTLPGPPPIHALDPCGGLSIHHAVDTQGLAVGSRLEANNAMRCDAIRCDGSQWRCGVCRARAEWAASTASATGMAEAAPASGSQLLGSEEDLQCRQTEPSRYTSNDGWTAFNTRPMRILNCEMRNAKCGMRECSPPEPSLENKVGACTLSRDASLLSAASRRSVWQPPSVCALCSLQ